MRAILTRHTAKLFLENLCEEHISELRASGLSDETIIAEDFQTVTDHAFVAQELRWKSADQFRRMGPFLRIQYRDENGTPLEYARYKPLYPRTRQKNDGTQQTVKYEAPTGITPPPYYPVAAIASINTPQARLFITEGEKKAVMATQEGFPSIGLPGVTSWSLKCDKDEKGRKIGIRKLNEYLSRIDWQSREVFIVFDKDDNRNPDVNREAAELARALEEYGATVRIINLPTLKNEAGDYEKQGFDDYLVRNGRDAFQNILDEQTSITEVIGIDDFRDQMQQNRDTITKPGLYLDASMMGLGKSYLDTQSALQGGKMLVLVPTHSQCESAIAQFTQQNITAVSYPERTASNCTEYYRIHNIEACGLNASGIICPKCSDKSYCVYLHQCQQAKQATVAVATHERFHRNGKGLASGRTRISVHEDIINFLAPLIEADDFEQMIALAQWAIERLRNNSDMAARFSVALRLLDIATFCRDTLEQLDTTAEIKMPVIKNLADTNKHLTRIISDIVKEKRYTIVVGPQCLPKILRQTLNGNAFRLCQLLMTGRISHIYVRYTSNANHFIEKALVGIQRIDFPPKAVVVLNDGTTTLDSIPPAFRSRIRDVTPTAQVQQLQSVVQFPVDITKSDSSQFRLVDSVRAILREHPDKSRVGLISHKRFLEKPAPNAECPLVNHLTDKERLRIVKCDWFRGSESRGSNTWKNECDLLIIAGTPRVPASAVQNRLFQLGNPEAAASDGKWARFDYWSGRRLDGWREAVRSRGYRDYDWHEAARQIVHAELKQSIGRSRCICPDGIPHTIVLSTEQLGYPLADKPLEVLTERIAQNAAVVVSHLLDAAGGLSVAIPDGESAVIIPVEELEESEVAIPDGKSEEITARTPYSILKRALPLFLLDAVWDRSTTIKTDELTHRLEIPARTARHELAELERFGLITREGARKGWYVTADNLRLFDQIPEYLFTEFTGDQT